MLSFNAITNNVFVRVNFGPLVTLGHFFCKGPSCHGAFVLEPPIE
jgi:hypothetical protein